MALNTIEYATLLQTKLDQKAVAEMTSGWMDQNTGDVIYKGGNKVKIPTLSTSGLKDYDKDNGYPEGSVNLSYEEMTMEMDRSTSFLIDAMDVDESNFVASATNVANEFQSSSVVPEIDAYRYSKVAAYAETANITTYTPDAKTLFQALKSDIAAVQDIVGENTPLICSINTKVKSQLEELEKFHKNVEVVNFTQGTINTKVKSIDNCTLVSVPSARMWDSYIFKDGKAEGEKEGGFIKGTTARQMNWIILPQSIVIAVTKQDNMKIIDPAAYQKADAWFIAYRRYHDVWVKANKREQIRVSRQ